MAEKEKEWKVTVVKGRETESKSIKVKQRPIEKPPPKPKDKFDLVLEGIDRCEKKIDKLKEEKK